MVSLKGVAADGLPELKGVLRAWVDWVESYCSNGERQDAPYWYNEQANTSTLVSAIAKEDGWALAEMTEQARPNSKKKVDLWFMPKGSREEFLAEAKRPMWHWYSDVKDWIEVAEKSMDEACEQVKSYRFRDSYTRLGMVFVVPMIRDGSGVKEYVGSLIRQFEGWAGCDARAWFFNDNVEHFTIPEGRSKNVYPGVMLLVRRA